jgi:hypothetical protein
LGQGLSFSVDGIAHPALFPKFDTHVGELSALGFGGAEVHCHVGGVGV